MRTVREGRRILREKEEREEEKGRRLKDIKVNKEGRMILECIEEKEWSILNRNIKRNEEEKYTYT